MAKSRSKTASRKTASRKTSTKAPARKSAAKARPAHGAKSGAARKPAPKSVAKPTKMKAAPKAVKSAATNKAASSSKVAAKSIAKKGQWVYAFGGGKAEGLAKMAHLGLPVPPGFTITTEVCTYFYDHDKTYPKDLKPQVEAALAQVGRITGKTFGDGENPLLVSVRSGGRASMPGMMDTVLNLGLNDVTVAALAQKSGDKRFAYDSYRRFITMYSDVVLGIAHHHFEDILDEHKERNGHSLDTDLEAGDWQEIVGAFKARVEKES